jgi:hypothetical protein
MNCLCCSIVELLAQGVPRMLRSASLLRRGALLIRGPWVPALRCIARCAAPRPGHERTELHSARGPYSIPAVLDESDETLAPADYRRHIWHAARLAAKNEI